jgi:hypothetical protein
MATVKPTVRLPKGISRSCRRTALETDDRCAPSPDARGRLIGVFPHDGS